jgi:N-acetylglucosaminyldiphosphoundecaprenol N-acetyl-beta-D-mannosaminyltransferase
MAIDRDFARNVWCLLGLPFDAVNLEQAADEVLAAIAEKRPCFLSTPNLNFLCGAQTDADFAQSVIDSDLSVADGFPIVLVAKLLGMPIPERVAGSDLIDALYRRPSNNPVKVFFFGGEPGAGELASAKINANPAGLKAVGHFAPGFGSVEDMSAPDIINNINRHDIDFLIVALGAKKGQAWIIRNKTVLKASVISHLGAVINFFAGSVIRAPVFLQRMGLEWFWRIYQEPALWRRYYQDGLTFLGLLVNNVLPYALWLKFNRPDYSGQSLDITSSIDEHHTKVITLQGYCTYSMLTELRTEFKQAASNNHDVIIDMSGVKFIDPAFLGLCLMLYKYLKKTNKSLRLIKVTSSVRRVIKWQKLATLLLGD